jgi:hypothetical protein
MARSRAVFPVILLLFGVGAILNRAAMPRSASLRTVEAVHLVACGMYFGVALVARLRGKPIE